MARTVEDSCDVCGKKGKRDDEIIKHHLHVSIRGEFYGKIQPAEHSKNRAVDTCSQHCLDEAFEGFLSKSREEKLKGEY